MQSFMRLAMPLLGVAVLAVLAVLPQSGAQGQTPPTQEATIAFAGPLDDPDAASAAQATQMALDEINAAPAQGKLHLKLMLQNDKGDPRTAENVARYLVKTEAVAVIGHWTSANSIAVAPIYTEAGMPQLAPIAWSRQFSAMPGNNHFQGVGNNDRGMRHALDYLVPKLNVRTVMIIDDQSVLGAEMADAFESYARGNGILALRQSVSRVTSDFNAPLIHARQARAQLILFTGIGAPTVAIVRSLKRLEVKAAILLTSPVANKEFLEKIDLTDEAVYAIAPGAAVDATGRMATFRKRYLDLYRHEPSSSAGFAYDGTYAVATAIRKAGSPQRARIVAALHETSHSGVNQQIAFNPDGSLKDPVYTLYQATRERWLVRKLVKDPAYPG